MAHPCLFLQTTVSAKAAGSSQVPSPEQEQNSSTQVRQPITLHWNQLALPVGLQYSKANAVMLFLLEISQ